MFNADGFAKNIKTLRRQKELTREMFAYQCGLSDESIRSYQACRQLPSTTTLIQMCSGLSVSANVLLEGLYTLPTEQESIQYIEDTASRLEEANQSLWVQTIQIFTKCLSNSTSRACQTDWGSRLKLFREEAGFSNDNFATLCGISLGTLAGLESGQRLPGLDTLLAICDKLHISPHFLLLNTPHYPQLMGVWYENLTPMQIKSLRELAELFQENLCKED